MTTKWRADAVDALCAWVVVVNLLDAILTMVWVGSGVATEANPILAPLLVWPALFVCVKVALVSLGVWILRAASVRGYGVATMALGIIAVSSFLLMVYHTKGVFLI
jgi:hypothetical protein